jgi:hypothetical protein
MTFLEGAQEEAPVVIELGDAAVLTMGNENESVESKQEPYS